VVIVGNAVDALGDAAESRRRLGDESRVDVRAAAGEQAEARDVIRGRLALPCQGCAGTSGRPPATGPERTLFTRFERPQRKGRRVGRRPFGLAGSARGLVGITAAGSNC
jgi:hypothetical protein